MLLKKCTRSLLHAFVDASKKRIKECDAFQRMQALYQELVRHCDRKPYQLEFKRCDLSNCEHCSSLPTRVNPLLDLVNDFGGSFPIPTESYFKRGHFQTFPEMYNSLSYNTRKVSSLYPNGVCEYGCRYGFFSEADKTRHYKLMDHKRKK